MSLCPHCGQTLSPNASHPCPARSGSQADPFLGMLLHNDFYIRSPLGEGGFARVYLADQRSLRRRAVIKILKPSLVSQKQIIERFNQEAMLAARLTHPGIAQIFCTGTTEEGIPFFAMEYVAGRPLSKILRAEGALEPKRVARLLALIAEAVDAAHEAGVIHRDLKPENIMIVPRTQLPGEPEGSHEGIKILDFGIAKEESSNDRGLTTSGEVLGTPYYMSPEQCNGEQVDRGTDLYSLGVIAFEMFTGRVPFIGPTPSSILLQHISMPPPHLEEVCGKKFPPVLEGVISRALSKHPAQRHSSAREFALAVAHAVNARVVLSRPQSGSSSQFSMPPPEPEVSFPERGFSDIPPSRPWERADLPYRGTRIPYILGMVVLLVSVVVLLALFRTQKLHEAEILPATEPTLAAKEASSSRPAEPRIQPSTPSPGATLPPGASIAKVPPLPAERMGLPPPDTRKMIEIKGGAFPMGPPPGVPVVVKRFFLDAYEVTNEDYKKCVLAKRCRPAEEYLGFRDPKKPVVGVSWEDARGYCAWLGKRLPTEAEWEKAAVGDTGARYPWGNEIDCERANYGGAMTAKSCREKNPAHTANVGSYPDGVSPYGVYDLAGNVSEWVADAFVEGYVPPKGSKDPRGPEYGEGLAPLYVVRGGSWRDEEEGVRAHVRSGLAPSSRLADVGFRCARD